MAFGDQNLTLKNADFGVILINAASENADDAGIGPRFRFAFAQYFRVGVKRVTRENGGGQLDFFPSQIGNGGRAHVRHTHAHHNRNGERAGH